MSALEFEQNDREEFVVLPPDLSARGEPTPPKSMQYLAVSEKPLSEEVEEIVSAFRRLGRGGSANITYSSGDVRTLKANSQRVMERLRHSANLWHADYQTIMYQSLIQVSVAGGLLLLMLLAIAFFCFVQTATSLGSRTISVLESFMVIPQPVASAMR